MTSLPPPTFETTTARLGLRRPRPEDDDFVVALHGDPRLYSHAPHARRSDAANAELAEAVRHHWDEHGFGYWLVEERSTGERVGMAGVRRAEDHLNLYYRFVPGAHGRGYAREAAREAVALATEWRPDLPVRAVVRPDHAASLRVAEVAGLLPAGTVRHPDDLPEEAPSVLLEAPRVEQVDVLDDAARVGLLDLWCRVNDTGGAVGFRPGATREEVAVALARHEEQMGSGLATLGALRAPDGRLLGLGWWVATPTPLLAHGRTLYRVMVDPDLRGRGLGRVLMAGLHRLARGLDGVELVTLDYRSGTGVGAFYARCGYTEVGRLPGAIRVAPGDDRDDVLMARRLDGRPLRAHGGG